MRRLSKRREREARRLCIAEGPHLVAEAAGAGATIELLLVLAGVEPGGGAGAGRGGGTDDGAGGGSGARYGREVRRMRRGAASAAGGGAGGGVDGDGGGAGAGVDGDDGGAGGGRGAGRGATARGDAGTGRGRRAPVRAGGDRGAGPGPATGPAALPPALRTVAVSRRVLEAVAETEAPQGLVAVVRIPEPQPPDEVDLVLAADGVRDPGNLGALLRTAVAFGAGALVLGPGCVDPWGGKALRAAAGATFRLPPLLVPDLAAWLRERGGDRWALVPRGGERLPSADLAASGRLTLVVGSEAAGVSPRVAAACRALTVPMAGPAESLNVTVAAAVALYEAARQRAPGRPVWAPGRRG